MKLPHPKKFRTLYADNDPKARQALKFLNKFDNRFGLDIETMKAPAFLGDPKAGLCPHRTEIRLIQITDLESLTTVVFDMTNINSKIKLTLKKFLETKKFYAHNAMFETMHIMGLGINFLDVYCTMIQYLILLRMKVPNPGAYSASLQHTAKALLNYDVNKDMQVSDWSQQELTQEQIDYAAEDAVLTLLLGEILTPVMMKHSAKVHMINQKAINSVARMQRSGLYLDETLHKKMIRSWERTHTKAEKNALKAFGDDINLKSGCQLSNWMDENIDKDILKTVPKTDSGKYYKTDSDTLKAFEDIKGFKELAEFKKYQKLISTYGENLLKQVNPATGRIHSAYTLSYTTTGRLSSRAPNLQNAPRGKDFRALFRVQSPKNIMLCADYSQIELRCAAYVSKDEAMIQAYDDGEDLHTKTAQAISGKKKVTDEERRRAKAVNFGILFGIGATKLAKYAEINYNAKMTIDEAQKSVEAFKDLYAGYAHWQEDTTFNAEREKIIRTPSDMVRKLSETNYYTCSMNTPIQGAAAEVVLCALIRIDRTFIKKGIKARIVNVVHDEILVEAKKSEQKKVKKIMKRQMELALLDIFPEATLNKLIDVGIGEDWANAK